MCAVLYQCCYTDVRNVSCYITTLHITCYEINICYLGWIYKPQVVWCCYHLHVNSTSESGIADFKFIWIIIYYFISPQSFSKVTEEEKSGLPALESDANESLNNREGLILTALCQKGLTDNMLVYVCVCVSCVQIQWYDLLFYQCILSWHTQTFIDVDLLFLGFLGNLHYAS